MSIRSDVAAACRKAYAISYQIAALRDRGVETPLNKRDVTHNFDLLGLGETLFSWEKGNPRATFNGIITDETVSSATSMLAELGEFSDITIDFTSPGGIVDSGIALANTLNAAPQRITMNVISSAYSAGSIALQGADSRRIAKGGRVGIHRSWGLFIGDAGTLEEGLADLRETDERILELYSERVPEDKMGELRDKFNADTSMRGPAAIDIGLADEVITMKQARDEATPPPKQSTPEDASADTGAAALGADKETEPQADRHDLAALGVFHSIGRSAGSTDVDFHPSNQAR